MVVKLDEPEVAVEPEGAVQLKVADPCERRSAGSGEPVAGERELSLSLLSLRAAEQEVAGVAVAGVAVAVVVAGRPEEESVVRGQ